MTNGILSAWYQKRNTILLISWDVIRDKTTKQCHRAKFQQKFNSPSTRIHFHHYCLDWDRQIWPNNFLSRAMHMLWRMPCPFNRPRSAHKQVLNLQCLRSIFVRNVDLPKYSPTNLWFLLVICWYSFKSHLICCWMTLLAQ